MPRPTAAARSPSPSPPPQDLSADDIVPLAYDSEAELLELFGQWRTELSEDLKRKWKEMGGGKGEGTIEQAEKRVMQDFFEPMVKMVLSNCTIAGLAYSEYKKKMPAGDTEPFKDELHQRIVDYQTQLFEAREENVNARRTEPQRIAGNLDILLAADNTHFDSLAAVPKPIFAPEPEVAAAHKKTKGRKSVSQAQPPQDGPTAQQAADDFEAAREDLKRLLKDTVHLNTAAEAATQASLDASALT